MAVSLSILLCFCFVFAANGQGEINNPCRKGEIPDAAPASLSDIRYYFDLDEWICLAYGIPSPASEGTPYIDLRKTRAQCEQYCRMTDGSGCTGKSGRASQYACPPMPTVAAESIEIEASRAERDAEEQLPLCPEEEEGFRCATPGAGFPVCCNTTAEAQWRLEYSNPSCPTGTNLLMEDPEPRRDPKHVLGKSCEDNFCPEGYSCEQGIVFAWCCGEN